MDTMIAIEGLSKRFGQLRAVDDVSFQVERGEVLGFLGPNGAGKSTTMKMITGFLTPDAGRIAVAGEDIARNPLAAKRRIGYLPEGAPLYGDMTPRAFLRFIAQVRGYRGANAEARIGDVVRKVNLASVLDRPIETLSKGFKRRVGLAQAILHDPEVLILDEPTDGLDPNQKHEVRDLIRAMAADKVIVLSTHILEEVDAVCTRAIIISAGRIVIDGTPDELAARSQHHNAVTVALRGATDNGVREALGAIPGVDEVRQLGRADGVLRFEIFPSAGSSIVVPVNHLARDRGWEVEELQVERGRLDEVFRELTAGTGETAGRRRGR